jgi:hypothetical protein
MIIPAEYNFTLYRGGTAPFAFRIKDDTGAPLPFEDIIFTISKKTDKDGVTPILRKALTDDDPNFDVDDYSGVVTWIPTPAESRSLAVGEKQKYEVELRIGQFQLIYLVGLITGAGGINSD